MPYGGLDKKHTFFIYDNGRLFSQFAIALSQQGHEVYYYTPFTSDVYFKQYAVGLNIENVQKPLYFFEKLLKYKKEDVTIMFPDVGMGDLAHFLGQMGYSVFAAGKGDILEFHRDWVKKELPKLGLPVMDYAVVEGITALKNYLKKKGGEKVIKLDIFRGDEETWFAQDVNKIDLKLNKLVSKFGPFAEEYFFIIEEKIEGDEEPGFDLIFYGEDYVKPYLWGYEIAKGPYCGVCDLKPPKVIQEVMDKLKPLLKKMDWRGFISTEMKVRNEKPYLIDVCARSPHPLGLGYVVLYENFAEIIYKTARRIPVEAKTRGRFHVVLPIDIDSAVIDEWQHLILPKKTNQILQYDKETYFAILTASAAKVGEEYYQVPSIGTTIAVIVGVGNNLEKLRKGIKVLAQKVDVGGEKITKIPEAEVDEAIDHIKRIIREKT